MAGRTGDGCAWLWNASNADLRHIQKALGQSPQVDPRRILSQPDPEIVRLDVLIHVVLGARVIQPPALAGQIAQNAIARGGNSLAS